MFTRQHRQQADSRRAGVQATTDELLALRHPARELVLAAHQPAASAHAGSHASRFRGRGMDYLESRLYQPGDDVRNMDWRVTARTGKPHTKIHQEERERPVVVLVDLSPSMFFGTRNAFKSVVAARAAALLGWMSVLKGDRVGGLLFNGHHREIPPAGGRRAVTRLIRQLVEATQPSPGTVSESEGDTFNAALQRLRRIARPGSLAVLLSDLYQVDGQTRGHLIQLRQHCDLMICHVLDPVEIEPPPPDFYGITDGRRSGILETSRRSVHQRYLAHCREFAERVDRLALGLSAPVIRLRTDDDLPTAFRSALPGLTRRPRISREMAA